MIIVFGTLNIDIYIPVDELPAPGTQIRCEDYASYPGGKGANQAYAAARAGSKTALIGRIGDDAFGRRSTYNLKQQSILGSGIGIVDRPTGCAFILPGVGEENTMISSPGANFETTSEQVPNEILKPENTVLAQLLIPIEQTIDLFTRARERGARTVLNASPPQYITAPILDVTDMLVVNVAEIKKISEILDIKTDQSPQDLARDIHTKYDVDCIVTLGSQGVFAAYQQQYYTLSAFPVSVVDPTGAGDCFLGYLTALMDQGKDFETALQYAAIAGSLACRSEGAQTSVPYLEEVGELTADFETPTPV